MVVVTVFLVVSRRVLGVRHLQPGSRRSAVRTNGLEAGEDDAILIQLGDSPAGRRSATADAATGHDHALAPSKPITQVKGTGRLLEPHRHGIPRHCCVNAR